MRTAGQDRLFVPLTAEAFGWWFRGKTYEVRKDAPRWSTEHVYPGRRVELRRGYSGGSLWGSIGRVVRTSLIGLADAGVLAEWVVPTDRALVDLTRIIGWPERVVAFKVILDPRPTSAVAREWRFQLMEQALRGQQRPGKGVGG